MPVQVVQEDPAAAAPQWSAEVERRAAVDPAPVLGHNADKS